MVELLRATGHRTQAIVAAAFLIAVVQCWCYSSGGVLEDTVAAGRLRGATALVREATAGRAARREHLRIGRE